MSSVSSDSVPGGHGESRAELTLQQSLVVLAPLVRWLLRSGVQYGPVAQALKGVFLAEARRELEERGSKVTDSALSVLSGVHRKDVRTLGSDTLPQLAYHPSPAAIVFTRWLSDPAYREAPQDGDDPGSHRVRTSLPRVGPAPSFESLARQVSSDVHPRTLLDELQRLGLVYAEGDSVVLATGGFVTDARHTNASQILALNTADHLSAAVHNLTRTDQQKFLEQSVYADGLSVASVQALQNVARQLWSKSFDVMVKSATDRVELDTNDPNATSRMRFGVFYYHERVPAPDAGAADAPAGAQR
ncbi:MAG: hypothetical protein RLZZ584_2844 [Pseudomonadota bacterium]|jgi:hypothetical protein